MREEMIRVVETYIDAVCRNDADALPLHPDVVFVSPLGHILPKPRESIQTPTRQALLPDHTLNVRHVLSLCLA
jgi:hypothetical protein